MPKLTTIKRIAWTLSVLSLLCFVQVTLAQEKSEEKNQIALDTDQKFTITAGAPGTYNYFCSVHPKMTGKIIVEKP